MTTFSRALVTIATAPPTEVQAMVRGGLAVHGGAGLYTVSHIASGKAICHSDQQRTAKGVAIELLDWCGRWQDKALSEDDAREVTKRLVGISTIIDGKAFVLAAKGTPPQGKSIVRKRTEFVAVYPEYFTPSEELVAATKRTIMFVEKVFNDETPTEEDFHNYTHTEEERTILQREMIMARFTTGKQARISEDDIPIKGLVVYALPPGIEPGYPGVAQLTKRLWQTGKFIDFRAGEMLHVWRDAGEDAEALVATQLHAWLEMEDDFSRMVQSGWCDWAIAVNLFSQLSAAERKKVTDVLGFVGSDEQGWHAYGAKTFLRSKRLPELLRCRRAVKQALND